jgi:hypothetical protein
LNAIAGQSVKSLTTMFRFPNTNSVGKPFDAATIQAVWHKSEIKTKHAPLKPDAFGSLMWEQGYGNTNTKFGWEIDHINPVSRGGGDELENLQALQWEHNRHKRDNVLPLKSQIAA